MRSFVHDPIDEGVRLLQVRSAGVRIIRDVHLKDQLAGAVGEVSFAAAEVIMISRSVCLYPGCVVTPSKTLAPHSEGRLRSSPIRDRRQDLTVQLCELKSPLAT